MANVTIITGGGSGMGEETALFLPKESLLVIAGRHMEKLEKSADRLRAQGHTVYPHTCDTSKRESVRELVSYAASLGNLSCVIHCAGVSPALCEDPEKVLRINALGTIYVNQESAKKMEQGGVIVDVASNSAYQLPSFLIPTGLYERAEADEEGFVRGILKKVRLTKAGYQRAGFAYAYSKNFAVWYAAECAFRYGPKGIRVVSLSPGLIATGMGKKELGANDERLIAHTAAGRLGTPQELGFAIAMAADSRNGYLSGVDILCDGGEITGRKHHAVFPGRT